MSTEIPYDLACAILLADDVSPSPASASEALRSLRRALAAEKGITVRELVGTAHIRTAPAAFLRGGLENVQL